MLYYYYLELIILIIIIVLIINFNYKNNNENFFAYADYPVNTIKPLKTNPLNYIINNQNNKPNYTTYNNAGPLPTEMHLGDYYNNLAIPTISSSNFKVSPCCCPAAFSTSNGCVCDNKEPI